MDVTETRPDLSVIVVSTNEARWLTRCLDTVLGAADGIALELIVVENACQDDTRALVQSRYPAARVVTSENRGFAHANNAGAIASRGRYVLFLNPDTEVASGTFAALVAALDRAPEVGLAGVRQITAGGELWPTIRYFPSVVRTLGEALGSERWPARGRWAGERELDLARYDREVDCDWTSGSFMFARREALLGAGLLDERFFLYCEEPDLCLRIKRDGWTVRHLPLMTIVHHAGKGGLRPKMVAQDAYTRGQYARKHFAGPYRLAFLGAEGIRHLIRAIAPAPPERAQRVVGARLALRALAGRDAPPFGPPPRTAVRPDRPLL